MNYIRSSSNPFTRKGFGGRRFQTVFGRDLPAGIRFGESWDLADLPEDKSVVADGPLAGLTIREVMQRFPAQLWGEAIPFEQFPLLLKTLDCADVLSVQVHPDREACRKMGKGELKTECWYVLAAEAGAVIYKGLHAGVTRQDFAEAVTAGRVEEFLVKIPVKTGECHFLPAGTPHAIGAGLLIAEIQTPSDTTYRVFDWNRPDDAAEERPLHVAEALESIHFDSSRDDLSVRSSGRLVDCEFFKVDKVAAHPAQALTVGGNLRVIIVTAGTGKIRWDGGTENLRPGDTLLLPAALQAVICSDPGPAGVELLGVAI